MEKFNGWDLSVDAALSRLETNREGLTGPEARCRYKQFGPNTLHPLKHVNKGVALFLNQFKSPLILLLVGAAVISIFLGGVTDAMIILAIVFLSGLLGFYQERGALNALDKLMQLVATQVKVIRNGKEQKIYRTHIVPGDIVLLSAGDMVPADCMIIEANHLYVDEAALTGESLPVEKSADSSASKGLKSSNALFLGTMVASGFARAVVVGTGMNTEYGAIAEHVQFQPPETAFEKGVRAFGFFLFEVTMVLVIVIFALNTFLQKPVIDSFLFSLALAVGLTPQLLPAIITVNLSHGARQMAKKKVVIKRLAAIENFGQMNILCTDKTGTLTVGKIELSSYVDSEGKESEKVAFYGYLNASFQQGYANPIDLALTSRRSMDTAGWKKTGEIPYDFSRKRLSVIFEHAGNTILITKGAFQQVLPACTQVESADGTLTSMDQLRGKLENDFNRLCEQGYRAIAVAYGNGNEEKELTFLGFLLFSDPLKPDIVQAIAGLKAKGVHLKIITGDHHAVAAHVAQQLGMTRTQVMTGGEIRSSNERAFVRMVREKSIFAEVEPNQKERIVLALRKAGYVVGYLGDGVNDVSALHSADVSIAVNTSASAAKEAADIVLLDNDLTVLSDGIAEGRGTFANTLKYIYMATSANFGNMFSMAGISLFLSYLPLLPKQILLTNFLSDFPEMALATDKVDSDTVAKPVRWDLPFIRRFMIVFGIISSVADFMTFGVLLWLLKADEQLFRTGWFVESVLTASIVVLLIRTKKSFYKSRPSNLLAGAVAAIAAFVVALPYTPLGEVFGFIPLPLPVLGYLGGIVLFYLVSVETAKRFFFRGCCINHHGASEITENL